MRTFGGSLHNRLMESAKMSDPEVGMGATVCMWSDRHAATVIRVINGKRIEVQEDKATRTDDNGMSESQSYSYERDPNGLVQAFSLRGSGRWVRSGETDRDGTALLLGVRQQYYDYSL